MRCRILSILALLALTHSLWAADINKTAKFIAVADIHFNPFSSCSMLRKPCQTVVELQQANYQNWSTILEQNDQTAIRSYHDTNYVLFKKTLVELQKVSQKENPVFVLILGDFLVHDFRKKYKKYSNDNTREGYKAFVKKTLQYMTYEIEKTFPSIDVYPVVGNNDTYNGNYQLVPKGAFFADMKEVWAVLIKDKANQESFKHQFPVAGYYKVTLPTNRNHQLLMMNSVLFSIRNKDNNVKTAGLNELKWLETQLQDASDSQKKIMLAYHIPVGIDVLATFKVGLSEIKGFWKSNVETQFKSVLEQYPNVVTAMCVGHIHMDTYQAITLKKFTNIPVVVAPSVSPIFGNSPAFKVVSFDVQTFQLGESETSRYAATD